jgi:hypothetical protein
VTVNLAGMRSTKQAKRAFSEARRAILRARPRLFGQFSRQLGEYGLLHPPTRFSHLSAYLHLSIRDEPVAPRAALGQFSHEPLVHEGELFERRYVDFASTHVHALSNPSDDPPLPVENLNIATLDVWLVLWWPQGYVARIVLVECRVIHTQATLAIQEQFADQWQERGQLRLLELRKEYLAARRGGHGSGVGCVGSHGVVCSRIRAAGEDEREQAQREHYLEDRPTHTAISLAPTELPRTPLLGNGVNKLVRKPSAR